MNPTGDVLADLRQLESDLKKNDDYAKSVLLVFLVGILVSAVLVNLKISILFATPIYAAAAFMLGQAHRELDRISRMLELIKSQQNCGKNLKASAIVREAISAKREWKGCEE